MLLETGVTNARSVKTRRMASRVSDVKLAILNHLKISQHVSLVLTDRRAVDLQYLVSRDTISTQIRSASETIPFSQCNKFLLLLEVPQL